ncbi:MAG: PP2C family protein-serine/threonine phosphatase, partial [Terriglobia bacterium]
MPARWQVRTSDAEPDRVRLGIIIRGSSVRVRPPLLYREARRFLRFPPETPMAVQDMLTASVPTAGDKPRDDEIDLFGLTHVGKLRSENQDHFLICTLHRQMVLHGTSLPAAEQLPLRSERMATLGIVADGAGGSAAGGEASHLAVATIARYVTHTMECFYGNDPSDEERFLEALRGVALEAHAAVRQAGAARPELQGMATTLTLVMGVWPHAYVVQVGDSRCYHWSGGALHRVTRDQTMAQDLVDRGVLPEDKV